MLLLTRVIGWINVSYREWPADVQAINGGFPWLEVQCSCCLTPRDVDLWAPPGRPADANAHPNSKASYPCGRLSKAAAILSNATFVRRVSSTCCSCSSIMVAPDAVRWRVKRATTIQAPINMMNGHHEAITDSKSCVVIQNVSTLRVSD
jgi:hypothetical protein